MDGLAVTDLNSVVAQLNDKAPISQKLHAPRTEIETKGIEAPISGYSRQVSYCGSATDSNPLPAARSVAGGVVGCICQSLHYQVTTEI